MSKPPDGDDQALSDIVLAAILAELEDPARPEESPVDAIRRIKRERDTAIEDMESLLADRGW